MSNLPLNSTILSQKISQNLGIEDLNQVQDISVISQGFHEEAQSINKYLNSTLDNMFIETASETYLDLIGNQEGIYRIKEPSLRLLKEDETIYLKIESQDHFGDEYTPNNEVINKNTIIPFPSSNFEIITLEPIHSTDLKVNQNLYIPCTLKALGQNEVSFQQGTEIQLPVVPIAFRNLLRSLTVGFNRDVSIPLILESIENYRNRLLYATTTAKYGTETAIRLAIASNQLVSQFVINYDTYPYRISLFNSNMLSNGEYRNIMNKYAISHVETAISNRRADGTLYSIGLAKAISFSVTLYNDKGQEIEYSSALLRDYLQTLYSLGITMYLDLNVFQAFLQYAGINSRAVKLEVYKYREGFKFLSKDISISIGEDEYPFIVGD